MKSYTIAKEEFQTLILKSGNSMFSATSDRVISDYKSKLNADIVQALMLYHEPVLQKCGFKSYFKTV
jgi:hypothetical protein